MANPTSRATLIEYCLRRLGDPVIEINVDPDQQEDRVDEAIQYAVKNDSELATIGGYTPTYASPEQLKGSEASVKDDVFSFACIACTATDVFAGILIFCFSLICSICLSIVTP